MKAPRSITNHLHRQKTIEWSVMALMLLLCGGLTALQYHWTGEVARAEITRLRASLERQLKNLCQDFDGELARDYEDLVPSVREMEGKSQEAALLARYNEWMQSSPRPVFKRIVFATPTNGSIQLVELNQQQRHLETLTWPSSWAGLRENLSQKIRGPGGPGGPQGFGGPNGPGRNGQSGDRWSFTSERRLLPPNEGRGPGGPFDDRGSRAMDNRFGVFTDAMGTLVEYPIFSGAPRGGPPSMQWLIFELDMTYVTNSWLPELIAHYLNVGGKNVNNFAVTLSARPHTALVSTVPNPQAFEGSAVTTFNPQFGIGRARDLGPSEGRWKFAVSHRPDSLDALVAASRRRNLGLAVLLNGLMLAAGIFLVRYTRRSRELAERQMHFVANVSHELRTPLTVIQGAGENLARGVAHDPEAIRDYSQLILQYTSQLKAMVEQVLLFAGARKSHDTASYRPVQIGHVLGNAVAAVGEETKGAECEVSLEFDSGLPPVLGDALALERMFQNLISNAAKHGASGKWIGITAARNNDAVEIRVADRGVGIPGEEHEEIFKPFVRGEQAQERAIRGSGLGLSVVKEIVTAHGGSVSVESSVGQGTTFIVRLPVQASAT